jgi:hypothetical protein
LSTKAASAVRVTIRDWRMASTRNNHSLEDLARLINPTEKGWLNYFGPVLPGELHAGPSTSQRVPRRVGAPQVQVQVQAVSAAGASVDALAGGHRSSRARPLRALASWRKAVGLYWKSRMRRELHVRFREGLGVKLPRATRGTGWHCIRTRRGWCRSNGPTVATETTMAEAHGEGPLQPHAFTPLAEGPRELEGDAPTVRALRAPAATHRPPVWRVASLTLEEPEA